MQPGLQGDLDRLVQGFDGRVGVAVRDVVSGRTWGVNADQPFPQQSVSKLWVALATFDAIDRGADRLDAEVTVGREDLSLFHQPIRDEMRGGATWTGTVERLLQGALIQSDNAANDILIRRAGGPEAVAGAVAHRRLSGIRNGPEERVLQPATAGLSWRPEYSFGRVFWQERERLPPQVRVAALNRYLVDPPDGASPAGIVAALARLQRGELLSPNSTERMLSILEAVVTGPDRLKAGLSPGWRLAHKTGTGQVLGPLQTGFNDVGLMIAPDGRTYAVAVMIASTTQPVPARQALMANVARAVVAEHERRFGRPTAVQTERAAPSPAPPSEESE